MRRLLTIIEGDGDVRAIPVLIRRILAENEVFDVVVLPTQRRGEYPTVSKHFDTFFLAATKENAPILWVMDFDAKGYECPYAEANKLINRALVLRPGWPVKIAFLVKEYESLFLYDENATRRVFSDIAKQVEFPANPQEIRGAKEWLSAHRPRGMAYKETVHQEKITAHLDLKLLRERCRDFVHLEKATLHLVDSEIPN